MVPATLTRRAAATAAVALLAAGCAGKYVPVSGRVTLAGQPYPMHPSGDEELAVFLLGLKPTGERTEYFYSAMADKAGSFVVYGPERKGLPPGKYRVALNSNFVPPGVRDKPGKFWAKYGQDNSPILCEVTDSTVELTIDVDPAPAADKK